MILNDDETRTEKEQRKHFQPQGSQTPPIITTSDPTELPIQCSAIEFDRTVKCYLLKRNTDPCAMYDIIGYHKLLPI